VPGRAVEQKEERERRGRARRGKVDEERREKATVSPGMRVLGGLAAFCNMLWGYR
jgi:hypothetical protein